jgi:hypothetical protein
VSKVLGWLAAGAFALGCDSPSTYVVLDNEYPTTSAQVIFQAAWQAVSFEMPIPPGSSSGPQSTVAASANTAYVVLAPGWDPTSGAPPSKLVLLQSRSGYGVHLTDTVHIPVDDTHFAGNCAAGSFLSQSQADFIAQLVFSAAPDGGPSVFAMLHYDAATCTTTSLGDGGGP